MDITYTLNINASPGSIYKAVSTHSGINGWWSKDCKVGESVGEKSILKFDKQGTIVEMGFETKSLNPNSKVVWECTENPNPAWLGTEVITEIFGSDNGSTVVFSHAGFDEKWKGQEAFEMTKGGWDHFTASLKSFCEEGAGQPW